MNTIEWAVMQILNKSYDEIHGKVIVGNTRLTNMSKNDKQKFVDLVVNLDDKKIIIELNNNYNGGYLRNTLYAMNVINNSYIDDIDSYYEEKIQGILVNLNWYKKKGINYSKKEIIYEYPDDNKQGEYLLKIININLEYYESKCYNEFAGVDKLSKLLTIKSKEELKEFTHNEKLLDNYFNKMERLCQSKEYCKMVWDDRIDEKLRNIDAYNGGKCEGIEEGILQKQTEIILNMSKKKISLETISEYVNVPVSEIQKILKSNL